MAHAVTLFLLLSLAMVCYRMFSFNTQLDFYRYYADYSYIYVTDKIVKLIFLF